MTLFGGRGSRELRISSGCFKSEIDPALPLLRALCTPEKTGTGVP